MCTLLSEVTSARGASGDLAGVLFQCGGTLAFGFGVAYFSDWRMALLVTGCLPFLISGAIIQTR
jgi:hypothetical protein